MNIEHVNDAVARLVSHAESLEGARCYCNGCEIERRYLSDQVPALLKEIDERGAEIVKVRNERSAALAEIARLRALAREGWDHAREVHEGEGVEPGERVAVALKEIEATS